METSSRGALAIHIVRAISTLYNSKQVITCSRIEQLFYHTRSCLFVIPVLPDVTTVLFTGRVMTWRWKLANDVRPIWVKQ